MAENIQESSEQIKQSGHHSKQSSMENMLNAGAVDVSVKSNRPLSAHRGGTLHWFACIGPEEDAARSESSEEREQRLKMLREKQNEERHKKLEELKAQALAAQRFREMKEEERRRRIEELRLRDNDRRQQVGERKRLIYEAERDRRESILKKNMEREQRFELKKKNERGSLAFAFGSSTPRMLEPADTGGSFWGHRRATSTNNIMFAAVPLTRRSSERELEGAKKRATSAGGLERSVVDDMRMSTSMYEVFHWGELPSPDSSGPNVKSLCSQTNIKPDGSALTVSTSRSVSSHLGNGETIPAGCASGHVGRRRTDLMPTIPTRDSASSSPRKPFTKSPGRTYSLSRLDQLAKPRKRPTNDLPAVLEHTQQQVHHHHHHRSNSPSSSSIISSSSNLKSMSRSMGHLVVAGRLTIALVGSGGASSSPAAPPPPPPPQRPLRKLDSKSMHQLSVAPPMPPPRTTRAVLLRKRAMEPSSSSEGPSRPDSSLSQQSTSSVTSTVNVRARPVAAPRKPRPVSIAVTGVTNESNKASATATTEAKKSEMTKPPLPRSRKTSVGKVVAEKIGKLAKTSPKATPKATPLQSPCTDAPVSLSATETQSTTSTAAPAVTESSTADVKEMKTSTTTTKNTDTTESDEKVVESATSVPVEELTHAEPAPVSKTEEVSHKPVEQPQPPQQVKQQAQPEVHHTQNEELTLDSVDMTASMIAKVRITTEEEAKAALAERRRLAREEAERQAEAERLRIEEEHRVEMERQRQEEEQLRQLAEQQRHAEEERLAQAIKETQIREEEERLRREEELKQKLEKEEQERKAREESEKQRIEMQERLKQEEKEREARRKRVEAIMLRTRASKGGAGNQPKDDNNTNSSEKNPNEETKTSNNKPTIEAYEKQVNEKEAALFNGSFKNQASEVSKENGENHSETPQHSNGHRNGVETSEDFSKVNNKTLIEHNVTNTLLDLGELDPYKNANTNLDITADKITNEDNVNSNNPAESHSTTDFLL